MLNFHQWLEARDPELEKEILSGLRGIRKDTPSRIKPPRKQGWLSRVFFGDTAKKQQAAEEERKKKEREEGEQALRDLGY